MPVVLLLHGHGQERPDTAAQSSAEAHALLSHSYHYIYQHALEFSAELTFLLFAASVAAQLLLGQHHCGFHPPLWVLKCTALLHAAEMMFGTAHLLMCIAPELD
jgi:hypothetical protein